MATLRGALKWKEVMKEDKVLQHRISVGALIVRDQSVLMVNHKRENQYDFWVAPGGGVKGTESLAEAVAREVMEETGLSVSICRLLYIEEMYNPEQRLVKFWYLCDIVGGKLDCSSQDAVSEYIVDAKFMGKKELSENTIFPQVLLGDFWQKLKLEESRPEHIPLREMAFY